MPAIDEVVEGVGRGRLVVAFLDLSKAYVVDDEQLRGRPSLEAARIRAVGDGGVELVEQVDAPGVAHADALLAGAEGEGLEDVALAGACFARDDDVVVTAHEVESGELDDERLVELRLEVELEGLERLSFLEAASVDATVDALLELLGDLCGEDVLEERRGAWTLARCPGEVLIEGVQRVCQP